MTGVVASWTIGISVVVGLALPPFLLLARSRGWSERLLLAAILVYMALIVVVLPGVVVVVAVSEGTAEGLGYGILVPVLGSAAMQLSGVFTRAVLAVLGVPVERAGRKVLASEFLSGWFGKRQDS